VSNLRDDELEGAAQVGQEERNDLLNHAANQVYDFSLRVTGDLDVAAAVAGEALAAAGSNISITREGLGAFLADALALARKLALKRVRPGRYAATPGLAAAVTSLQEIDFKAMAPNINIDEARDVADYVWSTATTLNPKDYAVLDLHIRRGLNTTEKARAFGMNVRTARAMAANAGRAFDEKVKMALMLSEGRAVCRTLDTLLQKQMIRTASPRAASLIKRHVQQCSACEQKLEHVASPSDVFAALRVVEAPLGLREMISETHFGTRGQSPAPEPLASFSSAAFHGHEGGRSHPELQRDKRYAVALRPITAPRASKAVLVSALLLIGIGFAGIGGIVLLVLGGGGGGRTENAPPTTGNSPGVVAGNLASPVSGAASPIPCSDVSAGCEATVANVGADKLNMRDATGLQGTIVGELAEGDRACIISGPIVADGYSWFSIRAVGGLIGWAALADSTSPNKPWLTATGTPCRSG